MKLKLVWLVALFGLSSTTGIAQTAALDLQTRYGHHHTTIVVNEDGTAVEYREWSLSILKESAVDRSKRASVSYSTTAQTAEIVTAYTKKADGRRLEVPKDNYQVEINRGKGKDSPVYSDRTTTTVVFPDVAVGDTVVLSYRLTQTEPLFPTHFSFAQIFPSHIAYDDVRVRIDYPASLWVQYEARGMNEKEKTEKAGRKIIEWGYANSKPEKRERRNYSVYDPEKESGVSFSTFKSYAEIAAAYGERAVPKAAVTDRVKALAAEIVKDKTTPRDQARALYEWVATHITYAGNCIGIGAVVPRELSIVLDNRMGDCKDHATLLQALLAASGIQSTQALVNAGSVYRVPKIPVVSTVNHVITYIPSFDLYLDSTSDWIPFGMLPFQVQDKPVLLVEGFRDGTKTPVARVGSDAEIITSDLKISPNGTISGTIEVAQKGQSAAGTREWARKVTKDAETDLVKDMFRGQGKIGSGKLEKDDPTALTNSYHYKTDFTLEKFTKLPGNGAFYIYPITLASSIQNALGHSLEPEAEAEITCSGGAITEEYKIDLPKTMKVLSLPENLKLVNNFASYHATYQQRGNVLTVKRAFEDRTKGNVCSAKFMAEYKKFSDKVMDNLKEQVLYK